MTDILSLFVDRLRSPVGELFIVADDGGRLRAVGWGAREERLVRELERHYGAGTFTLTPKRNPNGFTRLLAAYFDGDLSALEKIPLKTRGSPFQRAVWAALRKIPCGTTISYGELARRIGRPQAQRAVGLANNRNPIGIVVPCHRVIGADGSLTGYGGGMTNKRWLLEHEGALAQSSLRLDSARAMRSAS